MAYQVQLSKKSEKFIDSLDRKTADRILAALTKLEENPYPTGCLKIVGSEYDYRIRVGDYRVVYQIQENVLVVFVVRIGHRKDIYR